MNHRERYGRRKKQGRQRQRELFPATP